MSSYGTEATEEAEETISQDSEIGNEEEHTLPDGHVKAIRHEYIRAELLRVAEASHQWTHPQPQGEAADDRTAPVAFPADQLDVSHISDLLTSRCLVEIVVEKCLLIQQYSKQR